MEFWRGKSIDFTIYLQLEMILPDDDDYDGDLDEDVVQYETIHLKGIICQEFMWYFSKWY